MKKLAVVLAVSFLSFGAFAQVERKHNENGQIKEGHENHGKHRGHDKDWKADRKEMMKDLNLTADQKAKLKEMHQANKAKKEAIKANDQLTQEQKKAQLKDLRKGSKASMQQILTPEQQEKFKKKMQDHENKPKISRGSKENEKAAGTEKQ